MGLFCILGILAAGLMLWYELDWWGLGLCFGITLAGLLAAYLGISGLLKMRYQKTSRTARMAAIGGALAGGLVGVGLGGLISVFGSIIGMIGLSMQTFEGPDECLPTYQRIAQLELPSELNLLPYRVRTSPLQFGSFDFRDHEENEDSNVWIMVRQFPKWTTANRQQFQEIMKGEIRDCVPQAKLSLEDTRRLDWQVANREAEVTRLEWKFQHDDSQPAGIPDIVQYYTLVDVDQLTYGMVLVHRPGKTALDQDAIRRIFASLQPAETS